MTTLHLRMTEPVRTRDAQRFDNFDTATALGEIVAALESPGLLEPIDLARVKAVLQKYVGGSASVTTATGVTRAGDAVDAARQGAARARAGVEAIQSVNAANKAFWDGKSRELRDSITR